MIWRRGVDTAVGPGNFFIWRRGRKVKDLWPLLRVNAASCVLGGAALTNVTITVRVGLEIRDDRAGMSERAAPVVGNWSEAGVLYSFIADRVAIGSELIVQELAILPRVVAGDSLNVAIGLGAPGGGEVLLVVDYDVFFTEDHEAWTRKKQRDCHDS